MWSPTLQAFLVGFGLMSRLQVRSCPQGGMEGTLVESHMLTHYSHMPEVVAI